VFELFDRDRIAAGRRECEVEIIEGERLWRAAGALADGAQVGRELAEIDGERRPPRGGGARRR
jgi:hypothetical protein